MCFIHENKYQRKQQGQPRMYESTETGNIGCKTQNENKQNTTVKQKDIKMSKRGSYKNKNKKFKVIIQKKTAKKKKKKEK